MNSIITLPKLTEMLSKSTSTSSSVVQKFLLDFTALVGEAIATDGFVKIKGIGMFRRNIVAGKVKIEFTPEKEFSDYINKPFSYFEPVELADNISADMLEPAQEEPEEESHAEEVKPAETPAVDKVSKTADEIVEVVDEAKLQDEPHQPQAAAKEVTRVEEPVIEKPVNTQQPQIEPEPVIPPQYIAPVQPAKPSEPVVEETISQIYDPELHSADETAVTEVPITDEITVADKPTADDTTEPEVPAYPQQAVESTIDEPEPTESDESADSQDDTQQYETSADDEVYTPTAHDEFIIDHQGDDHGRFPWFWSAMFFILGLLIGFAVGYFCHDQISARIYNSFDIPVALIDDYDDMLPTDSVSVIEIDLGDSQEGLVQEEEIDVPEPETTDEQETTANNNTAPTTDNAPIYDTVTPKRYLTTMALEHYGNKEYWVYIYLENRDKISNPNNVRAGTKVRIPPREKYDVSDNEAENLAAAHKKAGELFNKYGI